MKDLLFVYNFLAQKNNWLEIKNYKKLYVECIKNNLIKRSSMVDVINHSTISDLYTWGEDYYSPEYYVKLTNEKISEYYTRNSEIKNAEYVSRDLVTNEVIEYYVTDFTDVSKELKYNKNGILLQTNYFINKFSDLPKEYKNYLNNYLNKDKIFLYSKKQYGMIVEINHTKPPSVAKKQHFYKKHLPVDDF